MQFPPVPKAIHENIDTLAQVREADDRAAGRHQRAVEAASRVFGRASTVYFLLGGVASWIGYNLLAPRVGCIPVDRPPFYWLQGAIGIFDALIAATVLAAQNRQNREAEQRAHLELQVNLLSEKKVTKIISLLEELRRDLPSVKNRFDPEAEALQESLDPKAVLSVIEDRTTKENFGG